MDTLSLHVTAATPEPTVIAQAAAVLRAGGLVAFPTETVYGLGANALDAAAALRIFQAKGRPANNPIIVHVSDAQAAKTVAAKWPTAAERLAARFWPGPLTLVLPKRAEVPAVVTARGSTVAVRAPAHPVAQALLRAAALPIAAPSANRFSQLSPTRAEHVLADLDGRIDLVLDAGATEVGLESTVLDLTTSPPRVLRPGHVTPGDIQEVIGEVEVTTGITGDKPLLSPGLLPRHYSPRTPLECCEGSAALRVAELRTQNQRIGWLKLGDAAGEASCGMIRVAMAPDPTQYAARLYDELHRLDAAGLDRIVVELPPDQETWLAVRDRLLRMTR